MSKYHPQTKQNKRVLRKYSFLYQPLNQMGLTISRGTSVSVPTRPWSFTLVSVHQEKVGTLGWVKT